MFDIFREEVEWGGRKLTLETGRIARQADGAVLAHYGETSVLATVVGERDADPSKDFFPLTVNYQEKAYAAGKIPGGYFKREGRPTERETLICRLIDRPIRPLFAHGFKNETQVIVTVLSHDMENDPDIVAMVAVSAALTISGLPFLGPIAASRVGYSKGEYILNPTSDQIKASDLDLVVAGTVDAVLMVESEAKELSEDIMLGAVVFGQQGYKPVIDAIIGLAEQAAKEPWNVPDAKNEFESKVKKLVEKDLKKAFQIAGKQERQAKVAEAKAKAVAEFVTAESTAGEKNKVAEAFKEIEKHVVRTNILKTGKRIDGRDLRTVRPILSQVGVIPRTHGSALFTRGETQALVVATLGTGEDEQWIDSLEGTYKESFLLHYNFPPYSVGETGRVGSPGRREIGHGKLAWRAVHPMMPESDKFPYTVRVVSEITESNGSSSMASVCGASLSLMDAGVPIKAPVAGIAMGLIKEADGVAVLSDIIGDEDHLGDMDFKVAGSANGVTALQMDIKITGITTEIMKTALEQAYEGRLHILNEMSKALGSARGELGEFAPRIETITIPTDKIREVIGSGGSVIRSIVEESGAKIDISDDGTVKVAAANLSSIQDAINRIKSIASEPEVGVIYKGKVVKIVEFGAFVNFFGSRDGLVHISQMAERRLKHASEVVKDGQEVFVKCLGFDERGKVRLTMKGIDQTNGKEVAAAAADEQPAG
ncbi:polyribonucleotide nucleotidyltransferase [Rhodomicrobium sp. Az07]|uniref:polyribonucleotide nucleotidyltransferase n=1 Tax=Rhodomicrobium sp. Az07 TaxID=2839034 RepID=UPI001BE524F7|nr:polyribonucleotide nucleotidyltransferase [Rhodomicrobium sp. Az07]MBT3069672.1 polyribonucleotide nucleotidyltransferase [Rhodomicrobium sp. Az07]